MTNMLYECELPDGRTPSKGSGPDAGKLVKFDQGYKGQIPFNPVSADSKSEKPRYDGHIPATPKAACEFIAP